MSKKIKLAENQLKVFIKTELTEDIGDQSHIKLLQPVQYLLDSFDWVKNGMARLEGDYTPMNDTKTMEAVKTYLYDKFTDFMLDYFDSKPELKHIDDEIGGSPELTNMMRQMFDSKFSSMWDSIWQEYESRQREGQMDSDHRDWIDRNFQSF